MASDTEAGPPTSQPPASRETRLSASGRAQAATGAQVEPASSTNAPAEKLVNRTKQAAQVKPPSSSANANIDTENFLFGVPISAFAGRGTEASRRAQTATSAQAQPLAFANTQQAAQVKPPSSSRNANAAQENFLFGVPISAFAVRGIQASRQQVSKAPVSGTPTSSGPVATPDETLISGRRGSPPKRAPLGRPAGIAGPGLPATTTRKSIPVRTAVSRNLGPRGGEGAQEEAPARQEAASARREAAFPGTIPPEAPFQGAPTRGSIPQGAAHGGASVLSALPPIAESGERPIMRASTSVAAAGGVPPTGAQPSSSERTGSHLGVTAMSGEATNWDAPSVSTAGASETYHGGGGTVWSAPPTGPEPWKAALASPDKKLGRKLQRPREYTRREEAFPPGGYVPPSLSRHQRDQIRALYAIHEEERKIAEIVGATKTTVHRYISGKYY